MSNYHPSHRGRRKRNNETISTIEQSLDGKTICGAFRPGQKAVFEAMGITLEELKQRPEEFRKIICHKARSLGKRRCNRHGGSGQGRPITTGKYTAQFATLTPEEIDLAKKKSHPHLNEELGIMAKFIKDETAVAFGQTASLADKQLVALIKKAKAAWEKLDGTTMNACLDEMLKMCDDNKKVEAARKNVEAKLKTYTEIFKVENQRRAMEGEYLSKEIVANQQLIIFNIVAQQLHQFGISQNVKEAIRNELRKAIVEFSRPSLGEGTTAINSSRLENQDEGANSDYIEAEYSAVDV